jgi:hypothetical protein
MLLLAGSVAGCASPGRYDGTVPTLLMRAGSCHRLPQPAELYAPSDVAPPVSCASPHETETLALIKLPPALARLPERPERPAGLGGVCSRPVYQDLPGYLGADRFDRQWGLDVWMKFPTRQEWSQGVRVARCDLALGGGSGAPLITYRLRGALRLAGSAALRHCRYGRQDVSCDQPHTAEEVGGWTGLYGRAYPGARAAARRLHDECWRNAEQYTGGAIDRLPMRVAAARLSRTQWRQGRRVSGCWIVTRHGRVVRGTLRAGLVKGVSS